MKPGVTLLGLAAFLILSRRAGALDDSAHVPTTREELEELTRRIAAEHGAAELLLLATIDTESDWNPDAVNLGPGDIDRGGAWGLVQLTAKTARDLDDITGRTWAQEVPGRAPASLLLPSLNLRLGSFLMLECQRRARALGSRIGSLQEAQNVASMWNSGDPFSLAPESTRDVHVPRFLEHWRRRRRAAGIE